MKKVVFTTGRVNPPTRGHAKLFNAARELSLGLKADCQFFVTRTCDKKKNPLTVTQKIFFLEQMFPQGIFLDSMNAFTACREMAAKGYESATLVVGQDRGTELIASLQQYIGHPDPEKSIGLREINVHVLPREDSDFSATTARQLAVDGREEEFAKYVPEASPTVIRDLYTAVRHGLGVRNGF